MGERIINKHFKVLFIFLNVKTKRFKLQLSRVKLLEQKLLEQKLLEQKLLEQK